FLCKYPHHFYLLFFFISRSNYSFPINILLYFLPLIFLIFYFLFLLCESVSNLCIKNPNYLQCSKTLLL
ncbi:hypothetical protein L9F63_027364, partial [Diploptera punctata]